MFGTVAMSTTNEFTEVDASLHRSTRICCPTARPEPTLLEGVLAGTDERLGRLEECPVRVVAAPEVRQREPCDDCTAPHDEIEREVQEAPSEAHLRVVEPIVLKPERSVCQVVVGPRAPARATDLFGLATASMIGPSSAPAREQHPGECVDARDGLLDALVATEGIAGEAHHALWADRCEGGSGVVENAAK